MYRFTVRAVFHRSNAAAAIILFQYAGASIKERHQ